MPRAADIEFKGVKQVVEKLLWQVVRLNGMAQGQKHGVRGAAHGAGFELAAPVGQVGEPLGGRRCPLVGKVISSAGESVNGIDVRTHVLGQDQRTDREVFIVTEGNAPAVRISGFK
jgi:hypothetical protein